MKIYFLNLSNFHCTTDLSCPEEYPLLAETRMECIKPDVIIIQNTNGNNNKADILNEEEKKNYDNILKSAENIYEYNGKCYKYCLKGFLYDENNNQMNICKCELDKCLKCPNAALNNELCTKCNDNYYPKENDPENKGEYINCYKEIE